MPIGYGDTHPRILVEKKVKAVWGLLNSTKFLNDPGVIPTAFNYVGPLDW